MERLEEAPARVLVEEVLAVLSGGSVVELDRARLELQAEGGQGQRRVRLNSKFDGHHLPRMGFHLGDLEVDGRGFTPRRIVPHRSSQG